MMTRSKQAAAVIATAAMIATAGCSTKASSSSSSSAPSSSGSGSGSSSSSAGGAPATVKTGTGIQGKEITLGVLTDLTGIFAALGKDLTDSQQLYWDKQNAKGGICGKYTVKLLVKDHGYIVQNGVQLYSAIKDQVLALQQTVSSPINTALADSETTDKMVNIPEAWAPNLVKNPGNMLPGATYDIEMVNGIDYLLKQGKIKDGDTVGHIYQDSEYGAGGLTGSKFMAQKHNLKLVEEKIKPSDTDMTPQVTDLKAKGVKAIFLTTAPTQTASVAGVAQSQGLGVPILGNNPVFAAGLLSTSAGAALKANLYVAGPTETFDKATTVLDEFKSKYAGRTPTLGVIFGEGAADIMRQLLEKACASGDLTRDGLLAAKTALGKVDTGGLIVPLDFSKPGVSPSKESYILRPDDVPGGLKTETGPTSAPEMSSYTYTP
ncbi:MAG: ABC transporter substrate-binding protein [Acidimicrobiales bacterium]